MHRSSPGGVENEKYMWCDDLEQILKEPLLLPVDVTPVEPESTSTGFCTLAAYTQECAQAEDIVFSLCRRVALTVFLALCHLCALSFMIST